MEQISVTILLEKATAKAARVMVQYSLQYATMEKERANLDAVVSVLTDIIKAEAAQAEVDALDEGSKNDIISLTEKGKSFTDKAIDYIITNDDYKIESIKEDFFLFRG